ncbi:hypothetical protein [Salarchaeum sp. JOR-1]|uniref:DprA-like winged helix domain-containing protein n=1 Tax=Salarchaeum sp. JOR-1 TaxID=2599399 RepID=UPI0011989C61|nr:hypothetical protein [Salarchaeum sp. JOR-1]QDX41386.1 hypothetical protein FQU85_10925 [Salarchaeum sp. JOR-1]
MTFDAKSIGVRAVEAAVFAVLLWGFTGIELRVLAGVTAAVFSLGVASDAAEEYVGDYAGNVLLGVLVAVVAVAASALGTVHAAVTALGGLAGGWLVFDGVQHLRHGIERPKRTKNPFAAAEDTKRVAAVFRAIDDEPRTRGELAADLDLDGEAISGALDYLETSGRVERDGDTYRVNEEFSRSSSLRSSPRRLLARVLEPFRL